MIKVTLDTNVLISAIFWSGEADKIMILSEEGKIKVYSSKFILKEVEKVIQLEKFQRMMLDWNKSYEDLNISLLQHLTIVEPKIKVNLIENHPEDNRIIECAVDSESEYLLSYDRHILKLTESIFKKYQVKVLTPTEFLKIIK